MRAKILRIVRAFLWRLIGLNRLDVVTEELKENIDALFYFLSCFHDPSEIKNAKDPDLRILHQCDIQLLRIVSYECKRLHLDYWLDFGTLLGAVRHQGIIPWDDDMDISMPLSDYNKAQIELKQALSKYGIELIDNNHVNIGVCYRHEDTGIWLDIFAKDDYYCDRGDEDDIKSLDAKMSKCREFYFHHMQTPAVYYREECRSKMIGGSYGNVRLMYVMPDTYSKNVIHPSELIYPLSTVQFGGYEFNAPNNVHQYLRIIYGKDYMGFPRNGILHHDYGRGPLSSWAKRRGVDMEDILKELKSIADSLM
jgi:lipopolysaccharide cholinephosphotransferase